ncbi:hypothetical protein AB0H77_19500 [Streptomyces sp. NPDC050844]|uniref:hypothetical protein n=1 Tax=Streptomyces sp. NPDC050844 TaxID=3155790 RepID=UPI0033FA6B28
MDPRHMPERMAVFAVESLGPPAAEWFARRRPEQPARAADTDELRIQVVHRGVRSSVAEGSFLGGPFMALLPIAFCGALLAQFRMVLELSALSGLDPRDDTIVAHLLVIQGVHPTVAEAEAALREARSAVVSGGARASWWSTVRRLAYLIGLVTPQDQPRGKLRRAAVWAGTGALVLIGTVVPFVWVPVCAEMYRRATNQLAAVAARHFALHGGTDVLHGGTDVLPPGGPATQRATVRPGFLLATVRVLLACTVPVVIVVVVLAADIRVADEHWSTVLLAFLAVSAVAALVWYRRRR